MLERLNGMNSKLEDIQKSLDMYLETKRQIFPRFYFLSNDDLLEILGQSRLVKLLEILGQSRLVKLLEILGQSRLVKLLEI